MLSLKKKMTGNDAKRQKDGIKYKLNIFKSHKIRFKSLRKKCNTVC